MKTEILFTERQRFKQWWVWLILLAINGIFITGIFQQVLGGKQFGDNPMSNTGLIIGFWLLLLATVLFMFFKLETIIKTDGIYVRFFPLHIAYRKYPWDKISKLYIRKYNPITEYGGWGLRLGLFGKGNALNVSGNIGLQLQILNRPNLLIGTLKPDELYKVLNDIGQIKQ